ncbi:MAG TPA: PIN domain-containing protein [Acidimicrobiales bacterium]|nr:PIN domain-containing protein [Acidimicrobiales bacterium]
MALLLDTGPIYAAANSKDRDHLRCVELLRSSQPPFVVPAMVVAEASYLVGTFLGAAAEADFFTMLQSDRFRVEQLVAEDVVRITDLVQRYSDLPLGGTDASVVAAAERLGFDEVALDHRHFTVVRPSHVDAFTLLP